ncbi:MAG: radical SAM protein [Planctomycetota bacterium]|nr:MAG: radical SAM protein [Planctomycetota bacterium]
MRGDEFFLQLAKKPPFSKLHPDVAAFFKDYLAGEKIQPFQGRHVVNTHFPPYPSGAFDNLVEHFNQIGETAERKLYSVTLAITNRCEYNCWHCYNANRSQEDIPGETLKSIIRELQNLGAVTVALTGGEPLLRKDLEEIAATFDERTCLRLNTTGAGLSIERAAALRNAGLFAAGISLDSEDADEHDRLRGKAGAFETALDALAAASRAGLYPYVIAVATRDFLKRDRFISFMEFARNHGALEIHLLEPSATGKLAGHEDILLKKKERDLIIRYQKEMAEIEDMPILSSFTYLESSGTFGCGAGLTHLYIDGSGEVCPCNLVPLSFGNVRSQSLGSILDDMAAHFSKPRCNCVGKILSNRIPEGEVPAPPEVSKKVCATHLARDHKYPRFFEVRSQATGVTGANELSLAYDGIHVYYDDFWLTEAAGPIHELLGKLSLNGNETVFEAGCGTGYATALIGKKLENQGEILAADISREMLGEAKKRINAKGLQNVSLVHGDALDILNSKSNLDIIFSSWVLGYIPLEPFFTQAAGSLTESGRLAFLVHKENSPREPLEIFAGLIALDPSVMLKQVSFDFPPDMNHVRSGLRAAGLDVHETWDGEITFRYDTPDEVLEHLLKSGAGTVFYEAIDPDKREQLKNRFLEILAQRNKNKETIEVVHDYIACIAIKP